MSDWVRDARSLKVISVLVLLGEGLGSPRAVRYQLRPVFNDHRPKTHLQIPNRIPTSDSPTGPESQAVYPQAGVVLNANSLAKIEGEAEGSM